MEDAATAEISRAQLWQWMKNDMELDDGRKINDNLFIKIVNEEMKKIEIGISKEVYDKGKFKLAETLFIEMIQKDEFDEFLTLPAYEHI